MTDLPHVASRLFGTPLLIARPKLDVILGVLGPRLSGSALEPLGLGAVPGRKVEITSEGIAIVPVTGTLVARSGYLAAASGLMSYGDIGDAIEAAAGDPRVRGIVLDIDSPGGEVGGLFDLADRIAVLRKESGKPLWAVANEGALSAAYPIRLPVINQRREGTHHAHPPGRSPRGSVRAPADDPRCPRKT